MARAIVAPNYQSAVSPIGNLKDAVCGEHPEFIHHSQFELHN